MAKLTISVDIDVLTRAHMQALANGASINALVNEYLQLYAGVQPTRVDVVARLLNLGERAPAAASGTS